MIRNGTDGLAQVIAALKVSQDQLSVIISLNELFNGIIHLQNLSNHKIVFHIDTSSISKSLPDYGKIAALRHLGFTFLQSFGTADSQKIALASYLISKRQSQPVFHFFYPSSSASANEISPDSLLSSYESTESIISLSESIEEDGEKQEPITESLTQTISDVFTSLSLNSFEYIGPKNATSAVVLFGSSYDLFIQAINGASKSDIYSQVGLVLIHVYRPWSSKQLLSVLPKSVTRLGLVEQLKKKITTWSPLIQDFIADASDEKLFNSIETTISFQLGGVTSENVITVLKAISLNLTSSNPVNNLFVGSREQQPQQTFEVSESLQNAAKHLETAYTKVLSQLFPQENLDILNLYDAKTTGFENTPEFGYGAYLAKAEAKRELAKLIKRSVEENDFPSSTKSKLIDLLSSWILNHNSVTSIQGNKNINDSVSELKKLLKLASESSKCASSILSKESLLPFSSSWIIGSDAWSYDLGNSGVHHVLASKKNVNMLIIDSQPYSQVVKDNSTIRKKDIGLYAMNFGNVYVASVAVYSSYTQLLQALVEAEKFDGPSIVLAYLPYTSENDSPVTVLQETKKAIDSGYWPLYRWNPTLEDQPFKLDSSRIKKNLQDFLDRENHLTLLSKQNPTFAKNLAQSYGTEIKDQQRRKAKDALSKLLEGLSGPPLTVLFASDGGNAEGLAKKLARRAKGRGLKSVVLSMDDYPIEDLPNEENIVLITSTAGQGELPQNGRNFWEALKNNAADLDLASVKYSVFGLGDSKYWPRKEDKHYYNKPSHDLFKKFKLLGASELVPLGQGDDQDPDGFQQGYNEWEPLIWKALGVDNIAVADEPPPITNEDIKIGSNFLRGTIAEGLKDESTGAISASDQQLTKFHGIYMQDDRDIRDDRKSAGLEPAYSFMVRVRLPGCVSTPEQWLKMDELSTSYGNDTLKITTRGTFQLHGVIKRNLKPAIRGINSALIDTVAACGDVDRNVVAAALPNNKKIHDEVVEISKAISEHLLPQTTAYHEIWLEGADDLDQPGYTEAFENRKEGPRKKKFLISQSTLVDQEPLYGPTYLPRKFKINIAVPPYNDVDVFGHDIGLVAIVENNELLGFNVFIGGGMGTTHNNTKTYPRTGSLQGYVPKDKIIDVCEKIMLVQRDFGDRKNRKHARLKYTVDDMGNDVYREKVEERLGYKFEQGRPFHFDSNTDQFGWVTDESGLHHFTTFVENGRVEDTPELQFKTGFREIAKMMIGTGGEFRLTANQHILISNITDEMLPSIKEVMAKYKLDNTAFSGLRLSSAACVAFPTCGLAMAESERYLPQLITKLEAILEDYGLRHDSIVMRMTGCPNGCARPWLAEIACVGKAYGAYNLMLGGGHTGERLNKLYRSSLSEEQIIETLKPMFKRWSLERNDGEPFGDWVIRAGIIAATREGKDFWDNIPEEE